MSRFDNPRRWVAQQRKQKAALLTEESITPEEAREASVAILVEAGCEFERVQGYDAHKDMFTFVGRRREDGKLCDVFVPGETVAMVVRAARILGRTKKFRRPSQADKREERGADLAMPLVTLPGMPH